MDRNEWLAGLKVGDSVANATGFDYMSYRVVTIDNVTPKFLFVGGNKYRRDDGNLVPSSTVTNQIVPLTDTLKEKIEKEWISETLFHAHWRKLPVETLREVLALVEAAKKEGA